MNIAVLGAGAMGQVLKSSIEESPVHDCIGIIDPLKGEALSDLPSPPDVVIDFSHPANTAMLTDYCSGNSCCAVIATTGHSPEDKEKILELSTTVPVVFSANFSLGITVMKRVLAEITPVLRDSFDIEIIEKHHSKKLDAPSGTAKLLLAAMDPDDDFEKVYGREGNRRRGMEIGIHAVRGGSIAGEHEVIFAGDDELLEIRHTAGSKKIFARGALRAAEFLQGRKPGLYSMEDVLYI